MKECREVLRGMGMLGVGALASWHDSARFALAVMFVFTGIAHFTKAKYEMARMVPSVFSKPMPVIYATGVFELLGAAGLIELRPRALGAHDGFVGRLGKAERNAAGLI